MADVIAWAHITWLTVYVLQVPAIIAGMAIAQAIRERIDHEG